MHAIIRKDKGVERHLENNSLKFLPAIPMNQYQDTDTTWLNNMIPFATNPLKITSFRAPQPSRDKIPKFKRKLVVKENMTRRFIYTEEKTTTRIMSKFNNTMVHQLVSSS